MSAPSATLPLGVVIPTKNSMPYLESHLRGLKPWLHLAAEVVVVDSFSKDGTVDFLRQNLPHPNLRFFEHPPGLYASWNHGISQIASPYFFMATTGDLITESGIRQLVGTAEELRADVVISKPSFRGQDDRPLPDVAWPVDDIIATLGTIPRRRLTQAEAIVFTAAHPEAAMLGSSASNLYRTEAWKRLPFPTDFALGGDGAWAWLHAAEVTWAVVAEKFSNFLVHPNTAPPGERKVWRASKRADDVLRQSMKTWRAAGVVSDEVFRQVHWDELMDTLGKYLDAKNAFDRQRKSSLPWSLNPSAWRNRLARQSAKKELHELKLSLLTQVAETK